MTVDFDAIASANALDPSTADAADLAAETRTMSRYAEFPEFIDSKGKAMRRLSLRARAPGQHSSMP